MNDGQKQNASNEVNPVEGTGTTMLEDAPAGHAPGSDPDPHIVTRHRDRRHPTRRDRVLGIESSES